MKKATRKTLLAYLNTPIGRAKFDEAAGSPPGHMERTPEDYLDEYSDRAGIVEYLAQDTGYYDKENHK